MQVYSVSPTVTSCGSTGCGLALRNGVGQVLILTLLSFGLAVAVSRRAPAKEQKRQKERGQSVKLLHCITSVMS